MGTLYRRSPKGNWHAEYTDHTGKRDQKSTRTKSKKQAQKILELWEQKANEVRSGLIDPAIERIQKQQLRPIDQHRDEWLRKLRSTGSTEKHTNLHASRFNVIADHAGWKTIRDIKPEDLEAFADGLRDDNRAASTIAHYLQVAKQFTAWLFETDRISRDPLRTIKKPNPQSDRRLLRRMLLPDEWPWLLKAASCDRALLYELAIQTGLRSDELRSITAAHLHARSKPPYVSVPSNDTKDRRPASQYISIDLAKRISQASPRSSEKLFTGLPHETGMAKMLRSDLATARANWENRKGSDKKSGSKSDFLLPKNFAGEVLDFHALRHTCGAWLAIRGVHPKTIQTIMRHKSITLTMDTYGHLFPNAEPDAILKLADMLDCQ